MKSNGPIEYTEAESNGNDVLVWSEVLRVTWFARHSLNGCF